MIGLEQSELISPKRSYSHAQLEQFMKKMLTYEVRARQFSLDILEEAFHLLSITPKTTTFTKIEQMRLHGILINHINQKILQKKREQREEVFKKIQEEHLIKTKQLKQKLRKMRQQFKLSRQQIEQRKNYPLKKKNLMQGKKQFKSLKQQSTQSNEDRKNHNNRLGSFNSKFDNYQNQFYQIQAKQQNCLQSQQNQPVYKNQQNRKPQKNIFRRYFSNVLSFLGLSENSINNKEDQEEKIILLGQFSDKKQKSTKFSMSKQIKK